MDPMELQKLMALLQAHQAQSGPMGMAGGGAGAPMGGMPPQAPTMGVPPGRFGPGMPTQGGMPVDQIPGMMPQPPAQPDDIQDKMRRLMMSGGAGDLRNVAMALGPAAQAAGGMGRAMQAGQQMGVPAKAQGMSDPAERMFSGAGAAILPQDPMVELIAKIMRARGQGMEFPEATVGSPEGIRRGVR